MTTLVLIVLIFAVFGTFCIIAIKGQIGYNPATHRQDMMRQILENNSKLTYRSTVKTWYTTHRGDSIKHMVTIPKEIDDDTQELKIRVKDIINTRDPRKGELILVTDINDRAFTCCIQDVDKKGDILTLIILQDSVTNM